MCGIAGAFGPFRLDQEKIKRTSRSLQHRGPDAMGVSQITLGRNELTLLHQRLSIIDLEEHANQPMVRDNCHLIFNGEIYNYIELRQDLERLGWLFKTKSDSEVLLTAYLQWGPECLDRMEGMWAFAIADQRNQTLFLSRDRFGEKPLFYALIDGVFYFSSEPKNIPQLSGKGLSPNYNHIKRYLVNGFRSLFKGRETYFEGLYEVQSGHYMLLAAPVLPEQKKYWKLHYKPVSMSLAEAEEGVASQLDNSLKLRLRADVPVAFCLSGGVDSTILASLAAKKFGQEIHAFSVIDEDERYNETENIKAVVDSIKCKHHIAHTSKKGFLDRLSLLTSFHDAPVPTISYYVHSFLSEEISKQGYKVAISGTGADEMFTGYYDHYAFWLAGRAESPSFDRYIKDWRESYGRYVNNPLLQDPLGFFKEPDRRDHLYQNVDLFNGFLVSPLNEPFKEAHYCEELLRNRMMNELFHEIVPVILRADDSNSMMWSVENRSPFLDRNLAEFLFSVPSNLLIQDGFPKWLLRASGKGLLPDSVRLDKRKRGFNASINSLLDRHDGETRERLLSDSPIYDLVRKDAVEAFLNEDLTDNSFSKFMFYFISAKTFLETDLASGRLPVVS